MKTRKLSWTRFRRVVVCISFVVFFSVSVIPVNFCEANGRLYREEWKLPAFYPKGFDGYGRIDRIGDNEIVISDTQLKLARGITYATPTGSGSKASFKARNLVGYIVNDKREIVSLWLIKN